VVQGRQVVLTCDADGVPSPTVSWNNQGEPVSGRQGMSISDTGALIISSARPEDSGPYTCTAINPAGVASRQVNLQVFGKCQLFTSGMHERYIICFKSRVIG